MRWGEEKGVHLMDVERDFIYPAKFCIQKIFSGAIIMYYCKRNDIDIFSIITSPVSVSNSHLPKPRPNSKQSFQTGSSALRTRTLVHCLLAVRPTLLQYPA